MTYFQHFTFFGKINSSWQKIPARFDISSKVAVLSDRSSPYHRISRSFCS